VRDLVRHRLGACIVLHSPRGQSLLIRAFSHDTAKTFTFVKKDTAIIIIMHRWNADMCMNITTERLALHRLRKWIPTTCRLPLFYHLTMCVCVCAREASESGMKEHSPEQTKEKHFSISKWDNFSSAPFRTRGDTCVKRFLCN
jgi:hypothetical protein